MVTVTRFKGCSREHGNERCRIWEVLTAVAVKSSVIWAITPCSPLKVNRHFGGTCRLHHQGQTVRQARNPYEANNKRRLFAAFIIPIYCLAYSTLMMEATCSSETSVDFQMITRRYSPEPPVWGPQISYSRDLDMRFSWKWLCRFLSYGIYLWLLPVSCWCIRYWSWKRRVRPKRHLIFNEPHDVVSGKTELFTVRNFRVD
jgi:hypothetical protein